MKFQRFSFSLLLQLKSGTKRDNLELAPDRRFRTRTLRYRLLKYRDDAA